MAEVAQTLQDLGPMSADQYVAVLTRTRFDCFVEMAFRYLRRGEEFCKEPYLEPLCFALQNVLKEDSSRLLVNIPPRHLKSFATSICLPAFALGHNPRLKINVVTYGHELSREHTTTFNRLVAMPWFKRLFPALQITARIDSAVTTQGGIRKAIAVGGAMTGFGQNLLILDDLIKAQDISSLLAREEVLRFYRGTALTRFDDPRYTKIIAIQQRLHTEDFTSHLIENARFTHLNLPSIMPRDLELPIYDGYEFAWNAGGLLSPMRFSKEELDRLKLEMGTQDFSAQFLNDPLPDGSTIVDIHRIPLVDAPFDRSRLQLVALSIDTAVKDTDTCDYSVIATWGFDGVQWCLMDLLRERLEFPELVGATKAMIAKWNASRILIEDSHTGAALWQSVRGLVDKAVALKPDGSKIERISVCTERLYSGRYVIPKNVPWFDTVMSELRAFPHARHDDIVDTTSQFLGWARLGSEQGMIDIKYGKRRRR